MAVPSSPLPVCRFCGLLAGSEGQLAAARAELTQWYGTIDDVSAVVAFQGGVAYEAEMGGGLLRQWVRFGPLFSPEHLAKCKLETNMAETLLARQFSGEGTQRPINIDPGYVGRNKVVMATTKDASHRVYVREGIYEEVAMYWEEGWKGWPWTEGEYVGAEAGLFFERARGAYLKQLASMTRGAEE